MSKISDEIRNWCEFKDGTECGGFVTKASFNKILALADRIDSEMVELPKDRDGVTIHVGDTVYGEDGMSYKVVSISFGRWPGGVTVNAVNGFSKWRDLIPGKMTHISPDSWKRIADELDEMVDASDSADDRCEKLANLADRIRKLAKKEDRQCQ